MNFTDPAQDITRHERDRLAGRGHAGPAPQAGRGDRGAGGCVTPGRRDQSAHQRQFGLVLGSIS